RKDMTEENNVPKIENPKDLHETVWKGANFIAVAGVTSLSIVALQSPIKSVLVNLTKNNSFIPPYTGGFLGLAKVMYSGVVSSLGGSALRTIYVTGSKSSMMPEGTTVKEEMAPGVQSGRNSKASNLAYVASMSLGEIAVTNLSESLSTLKKASGILPANFRWTTLHNTYKLMTGGFSPRFAAGIINFGSLCMLEDTIFKNLPIDDKSLAHATSGVLSGMAAGIFAFPLAMFKDYVLVQSTVNDGMLYTKGAFAVAKDLYSSLVNNPGVALKTFGSKAKKQLPIRMGMTGVIFGMVAGIGEALGPEPLKKIVPETYQPSPGTSRHSLFGQSKQNATQTTSHSEKKEDLDVNKPQQK
ncbi:MAG: hypothetical protein ACHP6H_02170, partial [Legionellales bacterium]